MNKIESPTHFNQFFAKMKRGAIPPVQEMQQWKKQQLEEEERKKQMTAERAIESAREYISKNIGLAILWSDTALKGATAPKSAVRRSLLKEFAALGYQVELCFETEVAVPGFVFDWEDLYIAAADDDWFKVTLPEKSAV